MKYHIILVLCLVAQVTSAQKSKEITVAKLQGAQVVGYVHFDSDNNPVDTAFYMMGRDFRYDYITEYITLAAGTLKGIRAVLKKCDEMFGEDTGTSLKFNDSYISVDRLFGSKRVVLYGIKDDTRGYYAFMKPQLTKAIRQIDDFIDKSRK